MRNILFTILLFYSGSVTAQNHHKLEQLEINTIVKSVNWFEETLNDENWLSKSEKRVYVIKVIDYDIESGHMRFLVSFILNSYDMDFLKPITNTITTKQKKILIISDMKYKGSKYDEIQLLDIVNRKDIERNLLKAIAPWGNAYDFEPYFLVEMKKGNLLFIKHGRITIDMNDKMKFRKFGR